MLFACYGRDKEKGLSPHIVCCDRLTVNEDGEHCLYGCWFLHPNETFHLATRKFLQKVLNHSLLFFSEIRYSVHRFDLFGSGLGKTKKNLRIGDFG